MGATLKGQSDRVVAAEEAVERYKHSISVVDTDGRALNTARLVELNSQLLAARAATRTLTARMAQLDARRLPGSPEAIGTDALDSQVLSQLKVNLAEFIRQQENLRATLGPRHPAAVESEAQVRSLKAAIARETARLLSTARGDLVGAQARERSLEREVTRTETEMARTNGALVPLRQLEREALAQRSVYEKSLGRERELLEQESVGTTNASVVSAAKPNPDPVGLKPGLLLAAAALLGGLVGCAGAVLVDRRGGRLFSPARLTAQTGLPVIGVLPLAKPSFGAQPAIVSLLAPGRGTATARALYRIADALDEIVAEGPAHLLVIAASDGPVCTLVASNLVLAQAGRGRRALLVDGDARSGRLSWLLPRDSRARVVSCAVEGFPPFNATAAAERMAADPIPEQADGYDCVVIDGGAARDEVRLRQLASVATVIVLVAESGIVTDARIAELQDALMSSADKLVGVLLVVPGRRRRGPRADARAAAAAALRRLRRRPEPARVSGAVSSFGNAGLLDRGRRGTTAGGRLPWPLRCLPGAVALGFLGYVFVGTAPMADPSSSVSGDGSDLERVAVLALAAFACLSLALRPRATRDLAVRAWPIWLVLGWFCAGVASADFPDIALRRVAVTVLLTVIALAVAAGLGPVHRMHTLLVGVLAGVIAADLAVTVLNPAFALTDIGVRGFHAQKNVAGLVGMVAVIAGIGWVLAAPRPGRTLAGLCLVGFAGIFLLITQSKTSVLLAALGAAMIPALLALRRAGPVAAAALGILVVGSLAVALLGALAFDVDLLKLMTPGGDTTFTGRTEIWDFAASEIARRPWTGFGFGSFWDVGEANDPLLRAAPGTWLSQLKLSARDVAVINEAHNGYLDLLLQGGWPALALALLAQALTVSALVGKLFSPAFSTRDAAAVATLLALVLIVMLHNLTESSLWMRGQILANLTVLISFLAFRAPPPSGDTRP